MRTLLLAFAAITVVLAAAAVSAQQAKQPDPLAIGGKAAGPVQDRVIFPNMVKLGFEPGDITVAALEAEVPALVSGHDLSSNETWGAEPLQVGRVLESGDDITFDSYKALRAMNPDILITGHPQNLLKDKLGRSAAYVPSSFRDRPACVCWTDPHRATTIRAGNHTLDHRRVRGHRR
ncbi:MAG: hypothetical protein DMF87_21280 [Acidobacteria bacterium]|nr:MAG: hypothetical protein DMF87_21280 [Acidobacteriota bacterium]